MIRTVNPGEPRIFMESIKKTTTLPGGIEVTPGGGTGNPKADPGDKAASAGYQVNVNLQKNF
jgi:hypothetical protein